MLIPLRSLWHGAVKLLLLCPALFASAWLYMREGNGEQVTIQGVIRFWPILTYVLTSNMTIVAIPLLGGCVALLFVYLRAHNLRRIALLLLLLSLWLLLLPWVMRACFYTLYFRN